MIGIVGTIGAGKDEAGNYIASKLHIPAFQISFPLKQICIERGIEPTRNHLILLGTELARKHSDSYLAEQILEQMPEKAVITGMRQLGQIALLRSESSLKLISIDAEPALRFERVKRNGKLGEAATLEEFITREHAENSELNAQRLFECMKLADYHIRNEGSIEEFHAQIDKILT